MVAAVRGARARPAKPRPRAPKSQAKPRPAYTPAKLRAGKAAGVDPRIALACASAVVLMGMGAFLFTGDRLAMTGRAIGQGVGAQLGGLGFKVTALHLKGASSEARGDILAAAALSKDQPILSLDLPALRGRIEAVGWVEEARVVRLLPDTIVVHVKERPPVAVWQNGGVLRVIDAEGRVIPEARPSRFSALPLLVGEGAEKAAARTSGEDGDILSLVRSRPRLAERLDALVRVDNRRWDLRLKDGAIVQLPAIGEDSALIQLDHLDQGQRVLELGFERIDLRTPEMVVVRRREIVTPGQLLAGGA